MYKQIVSLFKHVNSLYKQITVCLTLNKEQYVWTNSYTVFVQTINSLFKQIVMFKQITNLYKQTVNMFERTSICLTELGICLNKLLICWNKLLVFWNKFTVCLYVWDIFRLSFPGLRNVLIC